MAVQPSLAQSCTPNGDLTVWTCDLRQGVKFHDGSLFDANDVVATFTMGLDAASPTHKGNTNAWDYYNYIFGLMNMRIRSPRLSARFPEQEVHGYGWTLGSNVTISIDDPDNGVGEDYTAIVESIVAPWDSNQTFAQFTLAGFALGLQPGHVVTMTDGMVTKVHTVSSLSITGIDIATNTITGTVEGDSTVDVDANCGDSGCGAI